MFLRALIKRRLQRRLDKSVPKIPPANPVLVSGAAVNKSPAAPVSDLLNRGTRLKTGMGRLSRSQIASVNLSTDSSASSTRTEYLMNGISARKQSQCYNYYCAVRIDYGFAVIFGLPLIVNCDDSSHGRAPASSRDNSRDRSKKHSTSFFFKAI